MTSEARVYLPLNCGHVLIYVSFLTVVSALSVHKLNNGNINKTMLARVSISTTDSSTQMNDKLPIPSGKNKNTKRSASRSTNLYFANSQVVDPNYTNLLHVDKANNDSLGNIFHISHKDGETIHMRVESNNMSNAVTDVRKKKNIGFKRQPDEDSIDMVKDINTIQIDNPIMRSLNRSADNFTDTSNRFTATLTDTKNRDPTEVCDHSCCNISNHIAVCSNCSLRCVPTDLPRNIKKLLLDNNYISSLSSGIFSMYPDMEELNLDSNNITTLPDGAFGGLEKLKILNLHQNSIKLNEDLNISAVFSPLASSLETLVINRNTKDKKKKEKSFVYPSKALSVLENLSHLHMDGLYNKEFDAFFSKLTKLTHLYMPGRHIGYCDIGTITNSTFLYLIHLKVLDLTDCYILGPRLQAGAFIPLAQLQVLNVSFNLDLGLNNVAKIMFGLENNANFVNLSITQIVPRFAPCVIVYKETVRNFKNSKLQVIDAQNNEIEMIENGVLEMLPPTLKVLNLTNNKIMFGGYWNDMASLEQLETLSVDGYNSPLPFPSFFPTNKWNCSEKNSQKIIGFQNNSLNMNSFGQSYKRRCYCVNVTCPAESSRFVLPLPPKLKYFWMHTNSLAYNVDKLDFCPDNNLIEVDLSGNVLKELRGPITGLNKITHLNITSCFIETIADNFFENLTSLTHLNLFQNLLGDRLNNDIPGRIFDSLHRLVYLNLSFNNLYRLNKATFQNQKYLEVLDLSTNRLDHINFTVNHMSSLKFLDIHKNDITTLPKSLIDLVDSLLRANKSIKIDMSSTPIGCDCSNLEFIEWITDNPAFVVNNHTHYYCKFDKEDQPAVEMKNGYAEQLIILKRQCIPNVVLFLAVAGGTILLAVVIVGLLIYRFRWTLRYWFHAAKLKIYSNTEQSNHDYDYDVFISYAGEDVDFIMNQVMPQLNIKRNLKVMVHGETFQVGRHIADNIYMAVRQCRKTLVLVTRNMLKSHWCTYELQMARQESIRTGRDVLIFLFLEEIPNSLLSVDVLAYIRTSTFIVYPEEASNREIFWNKLADDLRS